MQGNESVLVVIPTYNERENLPRIVGAIAALHIPRLRMFVVDDNSPDGTGAVGEELQKRYPLTILHRPRREGLGAAYRDAFLRIEGFTEEEKPTYIIHMDADLSHNPADIPRMLEAIRTHDVVIGSRYVPGGDVLNWSYSRRVLSRTANWCARTAIGLPFRDVTSGFRAYRREAFQAIAPQATRALGYAFEIEMSYTVFARGLRIVEIPIAFTERRQGVSKLTWGILRESVHTVAALRRRVREEGRLRV